MAATEDMLRFRSPQNLMRVPGAGTPQELTTEGGCDVVGQHNALAPFIAALNDAGIRCPLFILGRPRSRSRGRQGWRARRDRDPITGGWC